MLSKLASGITGIFTRRKLDDVALSELEELLIQADVGARVAAELTASLAKARFGKEVSPEDIKMFLAEDIARLLQPVAAPLAFSAKPAVMLVVGVNGSGKTTTIGKLANRLKAEGYKVMLAAADTFRAAAVEQLQEWGRRADIPVVAGAADSDPASVAFRAFEQAKETGADILLVDTAGRLHNKANLMAELQKISGVLKKIDASAPHHVLQVLDATIGQNTMAQVQTFKDMIGVTGLIVTKLDGTAKGGVLVALAGAFGLPVHFVGMGEAIGDLKTFQPIDFTKNLVGMAA